ncbi:MAG TPA: cytochrome P450 [Trueperaceae bacterium]
MMGPQPVPGPKGRWPFGSLPALRRDVLGFFESLARDYGPVAQVPVMGGSFYALMQPEPIEEVLVRQAGSFIKSKDYRSDLDFLGRGLLTSDGEAWLRQRRLMQPAFHHKRIAAYSETMVTLTEELAAGWQDGQELDLHADMMRLTFEIVAQALLGADVSADAVDVGRALKLFMMQATTEGSLLKAFLPNTLPTPGNLRRKRMRQRLDAMIYRIIRDRHQGEDQGDLLSMLLAARDEDGSGMSETQIRDELLTIVLAGHETTANALSWTLHLLSRHPGALRLLEDELAAVLGGRAPTVADLPRLPMTEKVIKESMRLYPPVWSIGREAARDVEVAGYRLPKGAQVYLFQWTVHRDERFYEDPLVFRPERWNGELEKRLPRFAYFPFGGGHRMCIGAGFAQMEARLLLASLAQRYRFRELPGHPVELQPSITLRPKHGLRMLLEARKDAEGAASSP